MRSSRLVRRSGLAAVIGGLLLPIYQLLHPARDSASVLGTPYTLIHALGIIALAHILFGLVGLYVVQADQLRRRGTEAFMTAFFGTALWVGALWIDAFLNPVMAATMPAAHTEGHGSDVIGTFGPLVGPAIWLLPLSSLLIIGGTIWFAVVTIRAGILPRLAGLMIIPGVVLFGAGVYSPVVIETVGGLLMGAGYAWMGYLVWRGMSAPRPQPAAMTQVI